MIFETHDPGPPHSAFVESIFHYKHFQPDHSIERVVPTGHVFILFELDDMLRHTFDNKTLQPNADFSSAWISGPQRNYISISAHEDSEMFVIQFKAFGAYPYLHMNMSGLTDQIVPGGNIIDGTLLTLREDLKAADASKDKFAVAQVWLEARYDHRYSVPQPVIEVAQQLGLEPATKLNDIVARFPGSQKHLISQFKKFIGLTPKQYQRVLRFNDVFVQMQNDQHVNWTDIADSCGFSDQSHFIREFKHFSGFHPESFIREGRDGDASNFFPLDRG